LSRTNEKKKSTLEKTKAREFIRNLKIELCITSPSSTRSMKEQSETLMKKPIKNSNLNATGTD